jgi:hypothetical protein
MSGSFFGSIVGTSGGMSLRADMRWRLLLRVGPYITISHWDGNIIPGDDIRTIFQ